MTSTHEGTFSFPAAHPLFADHFAEAPVVPGSLLVRAFMQELPALLPEAKVTAARGFRFRRFVRPGCYAFRMEHDATTVRCVLYDTQECPLLTGNLDVTPAPPSAETTQARSAAKGPVDDQRTDSPARDGGDAPACRPTSKNVVSQQMTEQA